MKKSSDSLNRHHNRAWLNNYRFYLEAEQGLADNTVYSYFQDCQEFINYISCKLEDTTSPDVISYLASLQAIGFAASTVARKRSAIKSLLTFMAEEDVVLKLNLTDIPAIRYDHKIPDVLTLKEMLKLLDSIPLDTPLNWRSKAMLELMYASGLRISETINLTTHDVYWDEKVVHVFGKGRKQRVVPVAEKSLDFLKVYVQDYRPVLLKFHQDDTLFLNRSGKPLSRMGAWKILDKLAVTAGISKNVSPHTIRHSFATHLVEAGANLRIVQLLLGHVSINTTQIYSNINKQFIIKEHRLYHPRK
ncbi:MAG: tyrosine recombinase [Candidatus Cloacimonetes bacterium]|nr:tyrosine recombinase [Candidatus Cloacimonadota bacterium]